VVAIRFAIHLIVLSALSLDLCAIRSLACVEFTFQSGFESLSLRHYFCRLPAIYYSPIFGFGGSRTPRIASPERLKRRGLLSLHNECQ